MGASKFAGSSEQEMDSNLAAVLDPAGLTCLDALAANTGRPLPCLRHCARRPGGAQGAH